SPATPAGGSSRAAWTSTTTRRTRGTRSILCCSRRRPRGSRRRCRRPDASALRLPEGELAARRIGDDAPPARRSLARLEQHVRAEVAGALGRAADLRHAHVGKPDRLPSRALDDAAAAPVAEIEGQVRAAARVNALGPPAAQPLEERA